MFFPLDRSCTIAFFQIFTNQVREEFVIFHTFF